MHCNNVKFAYVDSQAFRSFNPKTRNLCIATGQILRLYQRLIPVSILKLGIYALQQGM